MTEETKKTIKKIYGLSDAELSLISFADIDLTPAEEESLQASIAAEIDGSIAVFSNGSVVVSNASGFLLSFPSIIGAAVHDSIIGILRYAKTLTADGFRRFDAGASAIAADAAKEAADELSCNIAESRKQTAAMPPKEKEGDDGELAETEDEKWKA